jgi:DNA-binding transcriptional ArsR family regulator
MPETKNSERLHEALERIFHEPGRLAIMSAVCAADKGVSFTELKESCNLTDGNLNRHLKVLEEAGAVRIEKTFVKSKPRTTIRISRKGLEQFSDYLAALAGVLENARKAMPAEKRKPVLLPGRVVPVRA